MLSEMLMDKNGFFDVFLNFLLYTPADEAEGGIHSVCWLVSERAD